MFDNYIGMLKKLLEKLPFFNYLLRLANYIANPNILNDVNTKNQFEHALLDIVNALGLGVVAIGVIILYDTSNSYMAIVKAFNPLYVAGAYLIYGLVFSSVVALLLSGLSKTTLSLKSASFQTTFYEIFAHSLRFYAYMGLVLTPMCVHALGKIVSEGLDINSAFRGSFFWFSVIFVTLVWLPIRLYVKPIYVYLQVSKLKGATVVAIVLFIYIATEVNEYIIPDISDKLLDKKELCKVFREGELYKELSPSGRSYAEKALWAKEVKALYCE